MRKRYFFLLFTLTFLLLGLGLMPLAAQAQTELKFSAMEVDLWPEFDRQAVLVIYHITLTPQTSLPAEVTLRIPSAAGDPHAVAVKQAGGSLFDAAYTSQPNGEWNSIRFTATTPELQLEYYDPGLVVQDRARHFEYRWPGDYAIDSLVLQVQQPVDASQMRISPSLGSGAPAGDGMTYYTAQVGSLAVGQAFTLVVDYQKSSDRLSAESQQVRPSGSINQTATGNLNMTAVLPWVLGTLGIFLIAGGGLWYYQSGKGKQASTSAAQRRRRSPPAAGERKPESGRPSEGYTAEGHIYCQNCGKRASPNDRFCRACGTRLRTE